MALPSLSNNILRIFFRLPWGSIGSSILFYYATILYIIPALAIADESCSYCGSWRPWAADGVRFTSKSLLNIDEPTIQLPSCTKTPFKIIEEKLDAGNLSDREFPKPVIAKLKLMNKVTCRSINRHFNAGTVIKLQVWPKSQPHSEELVVEIEETNKNSPSLFWFLVRAHHNPCDEGGKRGELVCLGIINNGASYESLRAYSLTIPSRIDKAP